MKKIALYALVALAGMASASCGKTQDAADKAEVAVSETLKENAEAAADAAKMAVDKVDEAVRGSDGKVVELTDDNVLRPDTKVDKLTIVDFNATWCGPCKMLAPVFESAAESYGDKVDFLSVDIDKCAATRDAFGVEAVPTVVIMRPDGKTERYVGTQQLLPADNFMKIIKDNL